MIISLAFLTPAVFETTGSIEYLSENAYGPQQGSWYAENIAGSMTASTTSFGLTSIIGIVLFAIAVLIILMGTKTISGAKELPSTVYNW